MSIETLPPGQDCTTIRGVFAFAQLWLLIIWQHARAGLVDRGPKLQDFEARLMPIYRWWEKSVGSAYSLSVALSIYGLNLANWQYKFGRVRAVMMLYLLRSAPSAPWMSRPLWSRPKVLHLICLASINHKCNFRVSNQHYICMLLDWCMSWRAWS